MAIEFLDSLDLAGEVNDDVDAIRLLVDFVGEATTAPNVYVVDCSTLAADDVKERLQAWLNCPLFKIRVKNDHHFVMTHASDHLLWAKSATDDPWQEVTHVNTHRD